MNKAITLISVPTLDGYTLGVTTDGHAHGYVQLTKLTAKTENELLTKVGDALNGTFDEMHARVVHSG